jgi:PST family polysaccharide transporter
MAFRLPGPHSTAWVLAETGVSATFSFASLLLIGRVIGPHEAGLGAIAIAAFLLLDVLGASIFTDAIVQRPGLAARHLRSAVTAAVLIGAGTAALLVGIGPLLAWGAAEPELVLLCVALAPLLPFSAFAGNAAGLPMRDQRFRLLAVRVLLAQPVALLAGLVAAAGGLGAWAIVINQAVATLLVFAIMLARAGVPLRPALDRAALAELWPVAGPQIAAVVLMVGKYRVFVLALGLLLTQAQLAQAHVAFRMLDAALVVVAGAITRIGLPRFCALQHDRSALVRAYGEVAQLPALVGLPVALGVALVADDLVAALLGPAWAGTAEAARVVALAACLTFLHGDQFSLFIATGRARWNLHAAIAGFVLPLIVLAAIRPSTTVGAALAWSAQTLLVTPVLAFMVMRLLGQSPAWLLRNAAPGLVAGLAMVPSVLAVQTLLAGAPALLRLVAAVGTGGIVFVVVAWLVLGRRLPAALKRAHATPVRAAPAAGAEASAAAG